MTIAIKDSSLLTETVVDIGSLVKRKNIYELNRLLEVFHRCLESKKDAMPSFVKKAPSASPESSGVYFNRKIDGCTKRAGVFSPSVPEAFINGFMENALRDKPPSVVMSCILQINQQINREKSRLGGDYSNNVRHTEFYLQQVIDDKQRSGILPDPSFLDTFMKKKDIYELNDLLWVLYSCLKLKTSQMPWLLKKADLIRVFPKVRTKKYFQQKISRCSSRGSGSFEKREELYRQIYERLSLKDASPETIMSYCLKVNQEITSEKDRLGGDSSNDERHAEFYLQQMKDFENRNNYSF